MNSNDLFQILVGLLGTLGGWALKVIWDGHKELRMEIAVMNEKFVRRDDFKEAIGDIKDMLNRIFARLENKQDKN